MKKLLLRAFALIAAVLPLSVAQAAPKPPAVFGDFTPGKTFTLTVKLATSSSITGFGPGGTTNPNAPIPAGVPTFTVGQQVTFVIGKKGELIGPGFKINFQAGAADANVYVNKPKKGALPTGAAVRKDLTTHEPTFAEITFITFKLAKRVPTTNMVNYIFE
ncbi:MAG TPA: hypothetical protein VGE67_17555 [Haloferula sp.]